MASIGVSTEQLSLQTRLEQIEAAIAECHGLVSKMMPPEKASEATPAPAGAEAAGERCVQGLDELLGRLAQLAVRVGLL